MAAGGKSGSSSSCGVFSLGLGGDSRAQWSEVPSVEEEAYCPGSESTLGCEVYEYNN